MTLREKIVNTQTGEEIFRDFTDDEIKKYEDEKQTLAKKMAELEAKQAAKDAARQTVLDKLGLSADEVAALLG